MIKKFNEYTKNLKDKNLSEDITHDNMSEEDILFEMSNLLPCSTGLKYTIWYGPKIAKHKPRIKVKLGDGKELSIQIEDHKVKGAIDKISSKDLENIFKWIDLNKEALLKYWNEAPEDKIDSMQMGKLLKPLIKHNTTTPDK